MNECGVRQKMSREEPHPRAMDDIDREGNLARAHYTCTHVTATHSTYHWEGETTRYPMVQSANLSDVGATKYREFKKRSQL